MQRFLGLLVSTFLCLNIQAVTSIWTNGNATNSWNDAGNWSAGIPGSGDVAQFDGTSTANCTIDVNIDVSGIDIQAGYTGTIVQGSGFTIDIANDHYSQANGTFLGGDADIDMNNGLFTLSGGIFQSTSGNLFLDRNFTISGGHFRHNNGTVVYDDDGNQNYNVVDIDTFYNFIMEPGANNRRWTITSTDTMVVENRLTLNQGRIQTGAVFILDSIVYNNGYDDGSADFRMRGSDNGHIIANGDVGQNDLYIEKDNVSDTFFFSGNSGNPELGNGHRLYINSGVLSFEGNSSVDLDFNEIELNGGVLLACQCEMNVQSDWDNNAGRLDANGGTWVWDFNAHRDYRSFKTDTFHTMVFDQSNNQKLEMNGTDMIHVSNKFEWNNGRFTNGLVEISDTLVFNPGADDNQTTIEFVGSGNSHLISNSNDADQVDIVVNKTSINDTVFILDENGGSVNVGTSNAFLRIDQGTVVFSNEDADVDYEEIELNGGRFQAPSGTTTYQGEWDNNGGRLLHNNGTWSWDFTAHRDYRSFKTDTFYNMTFDQSNNQRLDMDGTDTICVINRFTWNNGRWGNGILEVLDTLEFEAGADDNPALIIMAGNENGHLISNSTDAGSVDIEIRKETLNDTVFILDDDGASVLLGTSDAQFTVNEGTVYFPNGEANINYEELEFNGGRFVAPSGTATVESDWDNNGGKFLHNNGVWEWDFGDHIDFRTTVVDSFYTVIGNQSNNKYIYMNGTETMVILNRFELNNGRLDQGEIHIVDTLILNPGIDNGSNAHFEFVGSGTSVLDINVNTGSFDFYIEKENSTDTVIVTDADEGTVDFAGTSNRLFINNGVVGWSNGTTLAQMNLAEVELNAGGSLAGISGDLEYNGDWDNNGGQYIHNNGTFVFAGDNHKSWSSEVSDEFYNFYTLPTGGARHLYMDAGDTIRVLNLLTLDNGRINTGVLAVQGDVVITNNYDNPDTQPTMVFEGSNPQTIDATGAADRFNGDYVINKSSDSLTLLSDIRLTAGGQELTYVSGYTVSSNSALFHFDGNGASVSGGSEASFNRGPMQKTNNSSITFPLGDETYGPAGLTNIVGTSTSFRISYYNRNPLEDGYSPDSLDTANLDVVSQVEYWEVERVATGNSAAVVLFWDTNSAVQTVPEIVVARWNDGQERWESKGASGTTGDAVNGSVTSNVSSDFSPHTLGSTTTNNTLPVELISFEAYKRNDGVAIQWATATEKDNDYFEILRSTDGRNFDAILRVPGAGTKLSPTDYFEMDYAPLNGTSYYKLKQVDYDGTTSYSEIRIVNFTSNQVGENDIVIYPNPVKRGEKLTIQSKIELKQDVLICLHDLTGKQYYCRLSTRNGETIVMDISAELSSGQYIVSASSDEMLVSKKIIVQ